MMWDCKNAVVTVYFGFGASRESDTWHRIPFYVTQLASMFLGGIGLGPRGQPVVFPGIAAESGPGPGPGWRGAVST
jgi:hypothetical protein